MSRNGLRKSNAISLCELRFTSSAAHHSSKKGTWVEEGISFKYADRSMRGAPGAKEFAGRTYVHHALYHMEEKVLTWSGRSVEHADRPGRCSERHDILLQRVIG